MQEFVDRVTVRASSGSGGAGAISFLREKYRPKGGPDGGDGGRGGDVSFVVNDALRTLAHLARSHEIHGENGQPGRGRNRSGRAGAPAVVEVPPGTVVRDRATGDTLWDAVDSADYLLLSGGRGGKGNAHFATSRHQTPRFAQPGEPGDSIELEIELRLIADVGLVGRPNAGKSSLLGRLTAARPAVAPYPFTTKIPNLGVLFLDSRELVIADIPGLIEGAARGVGLGHEFLRHISRTRILAYVVALDEPDPAATVRMLEEELLGFDVELTGKPRIIVGNKVDLVDGDERADELRAACPDDRVLLVSAVTGTGIRELAGELLRRAASHAAGTGRELTE